MLKIFKWLLVLMAFLAAQSAWKHISKAADRPADDARKTVHVTQSGSKFHRRDCRFADGHMISISLEKALRTYEPCSVCKPSQS